MLAVSQTNSHGNRTNILKLEIILDKFKPHLVSLSEANFMTNSDDTDIGLGGYNIELTDQNQGYNTSR